MIFGTKTSLILKGSAESGWIHTAGTKTAGGGSHVGRGTVVQSQVG